MTGGVTPEALAETHAAAFPGKGWEADTFASWMTDAAVTVHGDARCFAVIRRLEDEAEILTVATHPDVQGEGRATAMLAAALKAEAAAGAAHVILDVAEDNDAARALWSLRCLSLRSEAGAGCHIYIYIYIYLIYVYIIYIYI